MINIKSFCILSCILFFGCVSCEKDNFIDPDDPRYGVVEDVIQVNVTETFQRIDHFGASGGFQDHWVGNWPEGSKEPVARLLFSQEVDSEGNPEGIGLSMWRVLIGEGSKDQSDSGFRPGSWFRENECFLDESGNYDFTKQAGTQWFMERAQAYGVESFTAWATSPPYFMTENGYVFRTSDVNGFNSTEDKYDDYAKFLAEVMKYYEGEGYNFRVVCPFNETQYPWEATVGDASQSGTTASNEEVATITKIISQTFIDEGVNTEIMIPEAAQLRYLFEGNSNTENQLADFFNSSSPNYIGDLPNLSKYIAGHSYFSNGTASESLRQRRGVRSALQSFPDDLEFWQSEYSLLGSAYQQGNDPANLQEMDYALFMARIIHTDLVFGDATGWSFWTALNQSTFADHPFRFNLILYQPNINGPTNTDGTYEDNKLLWALGNYSRFVRPGMLRIDVNDTVYGSGESAVENFMVSGYLNPSTNEIVFVCVNMTSQEREFIIDDYGNSFSVQNDQYDVYTTNAVSDLEHSTVAVEGLSIPAKSVVTLVGSLN